MLNACSAINAFRNERTYALEQGVVKLSDLRIKLMADRFIARKQINFSKSSLAMQE